MDLGTHSELSGRQNTTQTLPDGGKGNLGETFTVNGATILAGSGIIQSGVAGDSPNQTAARQRIADIFQTIGTFGAGGFDVARGC